MQDLKQVYGDKILGTCTVEQAYGGMRSVKSMVYETSLLDPVEVSTAHMLRRWFVCMRALLSSLLHALTKKMICTNNRVSASAA